MQIRFSLPLLVLNFCCLPLFSQTLHVGAGQAYANLSQAVAAVQPGDTIEIHAGTYAGGLFFANLQGEADAWITIRNAANETVIFEGGSNAVQLTDPAYLRWQGLIFQHQSGNGFNTDDGGTYNSPAHHIVFDGCIFRDISASGNNDLLKLSGLDSFEVRNCQFLNGAAGGSGADMVGCHYGVFDNNYFENQGSNCIQAKGGTAWIRIQGNFFKDGGQRALNLGGSTGLQFFRPDTAHYEAAHLQVFSNIFVGGWAPIAYVGAVQVEVVNNTFYKPENWVIRILQETVDPDRFLECGDNSFINNIIYLDHNTNIGPNTRPESFLFSHNLWFNAALPNWSGPDIPTPDANMILNQHPLFADPDDDFSLQPGSPAIGSGLHLPLPVLDFLGEDFLTPRSRGAVESGVVGVVETLQNAGLQLYPNPAADELTLQLGTGIELLEVEIVLHDVRGNMVLRHLNSDGRLSLRGISPGTYWLSVLDKNKREIGRKKVVRF